MSLALADTSSCRDVSTLDQWPSARPNLRQASASDRDDAATNDPGCRCGSSIRLLRSRDWCSLAARRSSISCNAMLRLISICLHVTELAVQLNFDIVQEL